MDGRWASLVAGARAMMAERQSATYAEFGLDYSMQYRWDTERAEIVFSKAGTPVARADLQFVGSIAGREPTWLWGWANDAIPAVATGRLSEVRQYGEEQGFDKLTRPEWVPEGDDGHDMMIVSAYILGAPAFFHDHAGGTALYFVLEGFERL
ncbi:MAG: hypothetical protein P4L84_28830 [Isosphaeraceae bacterium]|nr:hypothetical protein [Isosphaeraceae bacterium]